MKRYYIAGIVPEDDGSGWSVYFPDIPAVCAGGSSVEEAIANAGSGLYLALHDLAEKNAAINEPSSLADVKEKVRAVRAADGLSCPEATVYQYIAAPELKTVPVRINVSLAKALLAEMDKEARLRGLTRSGLLTVAAKEYLGKAAR